MCDLQYSNNQYFEICLKAVQEIPILEQLIEQILNFLQKQNIGQIISIINKLQEKDFYHIFDNNGWEVSIIHQICSNTSFEVIKAILNRPDINKTKLFSFVCENYSTPLVSLCTMSQMRKDFRILEYVVNNPDIMLDQIVSVTDSYGKNIFHRLVEVNNFEAFELLINKLYDQILIKCLKMEDHISLTPLMCAAKLDNDDFISGIGNLQLEEVITYENVNNETALDIAKDCQNLDAISLIESFLPSFY